ncbi:uncharacterized protein LOC135111261 [Scylla paramamosain]|uniref:uncharacterized protein LOC135111261 n=1 Tax=Scylla paramamosain TaxID=85552 RepID=UPI00308354A8
MTYTLKSLLCHSTVNVKKGTALPRLSEISLFFLSPFSSKSERLRFSVNLLGVSAGLCPIRLRKVVKARGGEWWEVVERRVMEEEAVDPRRDNCITLMDCRKNWPCSCHTSTTLLIGTTAAHHLPNHQSATTTTCLTTRAPPPPPPASPPERHNLLPHHQSATTTCLTTIAPQPPLRTSSHAIITATFTALTAPPPPPPAKQVSSSHQAFMETKSMDDAEKDLQLAPLTVIAVKRKRDDTSRGGRGARGFTAFCN